MHIILGLVAWLLISPSLGIALGGEPGEVCKSSLLFAALCKGTKTWFPRLDLGELKGHPTPKLQVGWVEVSVTTAIQFHFSFGPICFPHFYRCFSLTYTPINLLHINLHCKICYPECNLKQILDCHPNQMRNIHYFCDAIIWEKCNFAQYNFDSHQH